MKRIISILLIAVMLTGCTQEISTASSWPEPLSSSPETSSAPESGTPSSKASAPAVSSAPAKPLTNDELLEQLKSGDISNVLVENEYPDQKAFDRHCSSVTGIYSEWIQMDVNNDGFDDLILQNIDEYNPEIKRIFAIYSAETGKVRCHLWDENDLTEYYFIAENGNLVYHSFEYGAFDFVVYQYHVFDNNWNKTCIQRLIISNEYDYDNDVSMGKTSYERDTLQITEEGTENWNNESITKEQFFEDFQKMTGVPFEEMKPEDLILWDEE